ncbi:MAG: amidohydrolase [Acidobacteriota bacterium]
MSLPSVVSRRAVAVVGSVALVLSLLLVAPGAGQQTPAADLVLRGGKVVTLDVDSTVAEAIAVRGHEIVAVGSDDEIAAYVDADTEVIDLDGRLATPGLIEGHGHFSSLGRAQMILDLTEARTWQEIVAMVEAAAREAEPGEWIQGRGWHQEKWDEEPARSVEGVPVHDGLSEVSPDNPVLLGHASGHAAFANALAMEMAGIDADTPDPDGGTIVRDEDGEATGLLRETAQRLVGAVLAAERERMTDAERDAEFRRMVELAGQEALSKGVTSFHDAGAPFSEIDRYRQLADEGSLPVRLYVMVRRASNEEMERLLPRYRIIPEGNDFLAVRSIKRQIDGALGAHGAWLLEPYEDLDSEGLVLEDPEDIERTAEIAVRHGFQVNTHAIGDRGNREVLDIYERVWERAGISGAGLRWRVEHAQHLHPDDIPRFAELGVIASMQGIHCTSDAPWVFRRLGAARAESGAYMWRDLLDSGAVVMNGTDVPVEDIDPIASFHASVTRLTRDGEAFFPDQAMSRMEALRSYTLANAYGAFEEHLKGTLEPGKLADVTVLDRDILTVPVGEILDTGVELTIVGGEIRHGK